MSFRDRQAAGTELAKAVADLEPLDPVVLALPRGGVPVGFEVAKDLECDLDVLGVRKVGVPSQPELAMGAVAEREVVIRNEDVIHLARIPESVFNSVVDSEREELTRRLNIYRGSSEPAPIAGRTVILVDDGLATGSTMEAGVAAVRLMGSGSVWVAVPVAPRDTAARIAKLADESVVLESPRAFRAVGLWYSDFGQTSDSEVQNLLVQARLR